MPRPIVRAAMVVLIGLIIASLIIVPAALGKTLKVTGTLVLPADIAAPSPTATAVITLIDATNTSDAGNIIGEQRIDGIGDGAISFAVPYEGDTIVPKHAYAVFATVVDDDESWQNATGVPVITGGPVEGVKIPITPVVVGPDLITGEIALPSGATLGSAAVVIAALIKVETGTLVGRQVTPLDGLLPTVDPLTFGFAIPFDPALIDPAATYVVSAAIVDGATTYETESGVPAITGGVASDGLAVPLVKTTASLPVASAFPSAAPTAAPTETPTDSAEPTEEPSDTPAPTDTPAPSDTPTPAPTATPTPTPTPTPVPSASLAPPTGVLTGTLDYPESYQLSAGAAAVVALVEGKGKATTSPIVATQIIDPAGQAPIAFRITYDPARIDPAAVYTLQAGIFDGDQAWVSAKAVPVITNGVQSDVTVNLASRPDVAKGEVTGSVTGVGITLQPDASSVTVIIDVDTGASIGVDLTRPTSLPAPFAIPFAVSDLQEGGTYVVQAELTNGDETWANAAGVPVITNGNPLSGVQVVLAEVAQPSPSPSATPLPTPAPSPAPGTDSGLDGGTLLLPIIIIVALIALGGFLLARSKDEEPPTPPTSPSQAHPLDAATAATAAATATAATAPLDADETAALFDPAEPPAGDPGQPVTGEPGAEPATGEPGAEPAAAEPGAEPEPDRP